MHGIHVYFYASMHLCVYAYMHVCICAYMHICVYVFMYASMHAKHTEHALTRTSVRAVTDRRPTMATRCESRAWAQAMQATMYGHSKPRSHGMTLSTYCMMRYIRKNSSHCLCIVRRVRGSRVCFTTHTRSTLSKKAGHCTRAMHLRI